MKTSLLAVTICLLCLTGPGTVTRASAAEGGKALGPDIYNESADASKQLGKAVEAAGKEGKHVLLMFGANWCPWCHKLHKLFESNETVSKQLKANYVVELIDVNKGHNKELVERFKGEKLGIPFLVVLDQKGGHLTTKNSGDLEEGDHHSPEKVMAFLEEWAPKKG